MRYSLWILEEENNGTMTAHKIKDTNSSKEVDKWQEEGKAASFYREDVEDSVLADYVQFFNEN